MPLILLIVESALLAGSCSLDAFAASFAYGAKRIRIPFSSCSIIILVCSAVFGLSLWLGTILRPLLPSWLTVGIAFSVLFIIGLVKLLDSVTKSIIRRHYRRNDDALNKELCFTFLNFSFILNLYANPEDADINENKIISPAEATALSLSLSLDGIAVGFGAALGEVHILPVFFAALITNMGAVLLGAHLGHTISKKFSFNMSWLSGVILMGLAVSKLF